MREDVEFAAQGATLRGWFYPAAGSDRTAPCVVLQHGFSAVKEMGLDRYAETFQEAGLSALAYDHPGLGASESLSGSPRQEIDPWQQIRCIQHAITYVQSRDDVDPDRIGLWGSSLGGGNAFVAAAVDRRVRAVVGQVPMISGSQAAGTAGQHAFFTAERLARAAGAPPTMIPVVAKDPDVPSALPTPDAWDWFSRTGSGEASTWRNEVTVTSAELIGGFEPGRYLPLIAPTPLLMIVAPHDGTTPGAGATAAYETAAHPKKLELIPGGHFDAYEGEEFLLTSRAARDWFTEHLRAGS
ncbi:alpha/beta hydrolase (plasmid) [Streptomyces sp. HUAS 31]|uniref:alpha/beta hydrolase n=1 Tax=Streptomyces TaxID=1883 RepID=UPI00230662DE|nr:alpha/beta hydrolase [Streptomyces sp. HUAS 31]WCE02511.1 alpha/beta hydrolase [Streptomyces sp. HUAS 31]